MSTNGSRNVGQIVDEVTPHADEVLVVDGHSRDRTREIAAAHGERVVLDGGRGKGEALRLALREATGEIVVFIDADGSHDSNDIPRLVTPIQAGQSDLVIASRGKGGSDELHGTIGQFIRYVGSQVIMLGINYRWNVRLSDSQKVGTPSDSVGGSSCMRSRMSSGCRCGPGNTSFTPIITAP